MRGRHGDLLCVTREEAMVATALAKAVVAAAKVSKSPLLSRDMLPAPANPAPVTRDLRPVCT